MLQMEETTGVLRKEAHCFIGAGGMVGLATRICVQYNGFETTIFEAHRPSGG
jgi:monoamine oxidase